MDRHLGDMREWYRHKLRELAGIDEADLAEAAPAATTEPRRDILSLTGDVDPIDRKLGELMRSLDLIEADTLTALLSKLAASGVPSGSTCQWRGHPLPDGPDRSRQSRRSHAGAGACH